MQREPRLHDTQAARYLVLNGSDVALVPPVQRLWGLQEVGFHEQGALDLLVLFVLVAVHDLPELLMRLWKEAKRSKI